MNESKMTSSIVIKKFPFVSITPMNRYLDSMKMTAHMTKRKRHDKLLPMKEKDLKIYNISYQSVDTESFSNLVSSVKVKNQQIPPQTLLYSSRKVDCKSRDFLRK
jgi:hypothetical protein